MSKKKKIIVAILTGLVALIVLATIIAYFIYKPEKPMLALYMLCAGGVITFNFLISLFLVNKNLK